MGRFRARDKNASLRPQRSRATWEPRSAQRLALDSSQDEVQGSTGGVSAEPDPTRHGRWHRIAIASIVDQGQVLAHVGRDHSMTCGFAVNANIRGGIRIFKAGVIRVARRRPCGCGRGSARLRGLRPPPSLRRQRGAILDHGLVSAGRPWPGGRENRLTHHCRSPRPGGLAADAAPVLCG
jgi:hypothetical protein